MTTPGRIRILIVEDNVFTRLGITTLLQTQPDLEVAGTAEDGADAQKKYRDLKPDVVICDLRMPRFDGFQAIAALKAHDANVRVLVLTNFEGDENIFRALKAGALGYVTKDIEGPAFFEAIRAVAAGQKHLPSTIAGQLAERTPDSPLTAREMQVLSLVFEGRTNREIARALSLAPKTAELYVSRILDKLGASSRTEAIAIALRRGLLSATP